MFREMPVDQIRTNLIKYTNRQIIKLDNLSKQKGDKIADELHNDYENRKATKEKVERLIPGYGGIKQGYINNIENDIIELEDHYIEFMEDYYSLPHSWIYHEHKFHERFESIYHYCKFMFPQYEWVRTYFLDQFMDF